MLRLELEKDDWE